jgi:TPR repeat protein
MGKDKQLQYYGKENKLFKFFISALCSFSVSGIVVGLMQESPKFDDQNKAGEKECLRKRLYWYELAALNGFSLAIQGTPLSNYKKAAYWYRVAALNGDAMLAHNLDLLSDIYRYVKNIGKRSGRNQVPPKWL